MSVYTLLKKGEVIYQSHTREGVLKFADKIGALLHFGDIKKGVLAIGFKIKRHEG